VLLSTAIIENGLDIPNVNTIIINDAWRFGLSQLYQLRGRVGRAEAQAYAYFLYQKDQKLTEDAEKRLQTILEASELGAGFRIAMRDLEIRGAGNLLGADQHGHVTTVGFDLYTRMLRAAVQELQGTQVEQEESPPVVVDLPLDAYLPDEYMGTYGAKVREYQRLASLKTIPSVEEAIADIRDRFGELPEAVANMATILRVKVRAIELGIPSITTYNHELIIKIPSGRRVNSAVIAKAIGRRMRQGHHGLVWRGFQDAPEWPEQLLALLDSILRWDSLKASEQQPVTTGSGDISPQ
jgi:transcription-repair coupling factor (superfamily II helicase)